MNAKSVALLMSLTIFVTLQMMSSVVSGRLFDKTKITLTNTLSKPILIHCKDQFNSDGPHVLLPGETHRFKFYKSPIFKYIWFCTIQWRGTYHEFDIFDSRRDSCFEYNCYWDIKESGPCQTLHNFKDPVCFTWDK
ncbi:putative plant self-incompatibility S1 [Lupinus albus]|uniref:S-protein homolog n=1 Tax=Lupinus albus TaxID=3870 RepID=A0A6A4QEJ2_LUPAL|nr:putative plant self-incompatibility S1 [Lupinus albus]